MRDRSQELNVPRAPLPNDWFLEYSTTRKSSCCHLTVYCGSSLPSRVQRCPPPPPYVAPHLLFITAQGMLVPYTLGTRVPAPAPTPPPAPPRSSHRTPSFSPPPQHPLGTSSPSRLSPPGSSGLWLRSPGKVRITTKAHWVT